jgi:nucleoside phosphorylase
MPSAVFFTGTAGALDPELKPGDVVIGTSLAYHDFGTSTPDAYRTNIAAASRNAAMLTLAVIADLTERQ